MSRGGGTQKGQGAGCMGAQSGAPQAQQAFQGLGKAGTGLSESCSGCCDSIWFESSLEVCALGAWFLCDSVEVVGGT